MEVDKTLKGWEFIGTVTAWYAHTGYTYELYGRELFGKVRYRLVNKDKEFDAAVVRNHSKNANESEYTHVAGGRYFNFDE